MFGFAMLFSDSDRTLRYLLLTNDGQCLIAKRLYNPVHWR